MNLLKNKVAWQAGFMSLGTSLSRILGLIRDLCLAAFFPKGETDIFFIAFRLPNFFRRLLGEGSFSASVLPVITESLHSNKEENKTKELHSYLFTLLFCVASVLTLLGVVFMQDIMNLLFGNSAYALIEGKLEKTIIVGRLVFTYLFFVSLYSYFMSVAQVFGKFFIPALAPAFFNVSLILFALTPQDWWPFPAFALGWAVICGGGLQLLPVLYQIYNLGWWPRFALHFKNPYVIKALRRFLPGMLGLAGLSLIGLINVYFSTWLEEGAPSYIYYGDRLLELPRSLIAVSLGTALIPELTKLYTLKNMSDFKDTLNYYFRFSLFLILPCALVFLFLAEPIITLLFGRGEFDSSSIIKTSMVLQMYSAVLIFSSLSRVFSSCFFALNKNWHIMICTVLFVCFHLLLAGMLTGSYGLTGLIGATALSSAFYFICLTGYLFYFLGSFNYRPIVFMLGRNFPGLILLGLCLQSYPYILKTFLLVLTPSLSLFFSVFFVLILGGGLYMISGLILKEEMSRQILKLPSQFFQQVKNKRKTS